MIPTLGAIIPAAVGVDIGCGMCAVRTQFIAEDVRRVGNLASLREGIEKAIPLSAGRYNETVYSDETAGRIAELEGRDGSASAEAIAPNWRLQLGSLGSGNHFIEVSLDELGRMWLFLHSGSRGVGNKLAGKNIKAAQHLCKRWWISLPDLDLEGVQCHHNYTEREQHFGEEVWLSRKGAIDAVEGRPGLIPGSMGTASYVVTGKGNRLALTSSPHGAGRNYSRSAARKTPAWSRSASPRPASSSAWPPPR